MSFDERGQPAIRVGGANVVPGLPEKFVGNELARAQSEREWKAVYIARGHFTRALA